MPSAARRHQPPTSRLRIRTRVAPLHRALPLLRYLAATGLLVAAAVGGVRFLTSPYAAGALEFTPHVVTGSTSAKGILGTAIADMDNDGDNDILTAGIDGIKLYLNNGKYAFTAKEIAGARGERVQVVDFDKDGQKDLLVSLQGQRPGVKWYRNEGGNSYNEATISVGNNDIAGYAGDLDNDGDADVATITDDGTGTRGVRVWQNDGGGTFTALWSASNTGTTTITIGKIAGTYPQIITGGTGGLQRFDTTDGTTWVRSDVDDGNQSRTHLTVADIDGDDKSDIVVADQTRDLVAWYRNRDATSFERLVLEGDTDATTVVTADLDNDGDLDIVAAAQDDNSIHWFSNDGSNQFTKRLIVSELQSVFSAAVGDLDKDNDLDVVAGDHYRGPLYALERIHVDPEATEPDVITQSTLGTGKISFQTTISDGDFDATRLRVQYSKDGGLTWDKPWLTKVSPDVGTVDLKNSNGFQVGTSNPIDTNEHENITLTLHWDTKSIQNTGGPLTGDNGQVMLRLLPRDSRNSGTRISSAEFRIDNEPPQGLGSFKLSTVGVDSVEVSWAEPTDSSAISYQVYYGTDQAAVLEQRSSAWDESNDESLAAKTTTSTTITGLTKSQTYTFKLVATDAFGNAATTPGIRGTTLATEAVESPTPEESPTPTVTPSLFGSPAATTSPTPTLAGSPQVSPSPTVSATPTPTPVDKAPSVLQGNKAPQADAGPDLVVNPSALVILDGTASIDADGDALQFTWRQLDGPKVELLSPRTSTPSFSAGNENETYIFLLTVTDAKGAIATETVTVATKALPESRQTPVVIGTPPALPDAVPAVVREASPLVTVLLRPLDLVLFALSLLSTLLLLGERMYHAVRRGNSPLKAVTTGPREVQNAQGKVVHYSTGEPLAGVQVLIYGQDGKLRASERTNDQGTFPTFFPAGQYTIGVEAPGFAFASAASRALAPEGGLLYTGGNIVVSDTNKPLTIVIPMKPQAAQVSSLRIRALHLWQGLQQLGRMLSWPIFLVGALLNTALVFIDSRPLYLILEVIYVVLVILKIALEVRVRPAYGQVRDAITHIPLDLAVVRLFEQGSNRLVMTRVTNNQGRFFALPPAGTYVVTITKPGYANFSKQNIEIKSEHDTTLQVTADLMPIAPHPSGLTHARAATL